MSSTDEIKRELGSRQVVDLLGRVTNRGQTPIDSLRLISMILDRLGMRQEITYKYEKTRIRKIVVPLVSLSC